MPTVPLYCNTCWELINTTTRSQQQQLKQCNECDEYFCSYECYQNISHECDHLTIEFAGSLEYVLTQMLSNSVPFRANVSVNEYHESLDAFIINIRQVSNQINIELSDNISINNNPDNSIEHQVERSEVMRNVIHNMWLR